MTHKEIISNSHGPPRNYIKMTWHTQKLYQNHKAHKEIISKSHGTHRNYISLLIDQFHAVRYCFLNNALCLCGSYDCT